MSKKLKEQQEIGQDGLDWVYSMTNELALKYMQQGMSVEDSINKGAKDAQRMWDKKQQTESGIIESFQDFYLTEANLEALAITRDQFLNQIPIKHRGIIESLMETPAIQQSINGNIAVVLGKLEDLLSQTFNVGLTNAVLPYIREIRDEGFAFAYVNK